MLVLCWTLKQISEHSRIEIGPVRFTDSGLDWLEKTHMRLAIGEPEKESLHVRLTTWSDDQQTTVHSMIPGLALTWRKYSSETEYYQNETDHTLDVTSQLIPAVRSQLTLKTGGRIVTPVPLGHSAISHINLVFSQTQVLAIPIPERLLPPVSDTLVLQARTLS